MNHFAGGDLAFASDSSALAIVGAEDGGFVVRCLEEIRPRKGAPLRPKHVIDTFATILQSYGISALWADGHYKESAKEHLAPYDITFRDAPSGRDGKNEVYLNARKLVHESRVRIPRHPRLLVQLRSIVSREVVGGGFTISAPRRAGGGHGDLVSALVLALWAASRKKAKPASPTIYHLGSKPIDRLDGAPSARGLDARPEIRRSAAFEAFERGGWVKSSDSHTLSRSNIVRDPFQSQKFSINPRGPTFL